MKPGQLPGGALDGPFLGGLGLMAKRLKSTQNGLRPGSDSKSVLLKNGGRRSRCNPSSSVSRAPETMARKWLAYEP